MSESRNKKTFESEEYNGKVNCGPCEFDTSIVLQQLKEANKYHAQIEAKKTSNSGYLCPIKEIKTTGQVTDNGNGTLNVKGTVPYLNTKLEVNGVPVEKGPNGELRGSVQVAPGLNAYGILKPQQTIDVPGAFPPKDPAKENDTTTTKKNSWWG